MIVFIWDRYCLKSLFSYFYYAYNSKWCYSSFLHISYSLNFFPSIFMGRFFRIYLLFSISFLIYLFFIFPLYSLLIHLLHFLFFSFLLFYFIKSWKLVIGKINIFESNSMSLIIKVTSFYSYLYLYHVILFHRI